MFHETNSLGALARMVFNCFTFGARGTDILYLIEAYLTSVTFHILRLLSWVTEIRCSFNRTPLVFYVGFPLSSDPAKKALEKTFFNFVERRVGKQSEPNYPKSISWPEWLGFINLCQAATHKEDSHLLDKDLWRPLAAESFATQLMGKLLRMKYGEGEFVEN